MAWEKDRSVLSLVVIMSLSLWTMPLTVIQWDRYSHNYKVRYTC